MISIISIGHPAQTIGAGFFLPKRRRLEIRNAKSLIGMPVIMDGRQIGRALDIGMDQTFKEVTGLYIDCGFRGSRFVPAKEIELIGDVVIFVRSLGKRSRVDGANQMRRALSSDGMRIGAICGALIGSDMNIEALELSRGYIDDLIGGRQFVRQYTAGQNGREVVINEGNDAPFTIP